MDRRAARPAFTEVSIRGTPPRAGDACLSPHATGAPSGGRLGGKLVADRLGDPAPQVGRDVVVALPGDQDPQLHLEVVSAGAGGTEVEVAGDGGPALVGQHPVEVVVDLMDRLVAVQDRVLGN